MDIKQRSDHTKIRFGNKLILQQRTNINTAVSRACLKNHSRHLYVPLCAIFASNSVDVARYASFIWHKSPTNCAAHLTESIFQTRSSKINDFSFSCICIPAKTERAYAFSVFVKTYRSGDSTLRTACIILLPIGLLDQLSRSISSH